MKFAQNVPLAPYTTFRIGGPARWFAEARSEEDVVEGVAFARGRRLPLFVISGGSNLLVSDNGFSGLVLRIALAGVDVVEQESCAEKSPGQDAPGPTIEPLRTTFSVGAGEEWDAFVARTVEQGYAGLECLSGIPGSAGATPVQNVGAYGQEVSQTLLSVRAYDRRARAFVCLDNAECGFGYRSSVFNTVERDHYIVTRVEFSLVKPAHGAAPELVYPDLKSYLKDLAPCIAEVRRAVLEIRARKGMVIVPGERDSLSAGSFFKNPVMSGEVVSAALDRIAGALGLQPESVPHYPAAGGGVKLSAAWLVEQAGFHRGYSLGRAAISSRHTLALINTGGARAADVMALRDEITDTVQRRFGVRLEPEPVWLGDVV